MQRNLSGENEGGLSKLKISWLLGILGDVVDLVVDVIFMKRFYMGFIAYVLEKVTCYFYLVRVEMEIIYFLRFLIS